MKFRVLRIIWSVMCGIICALLAALWMRSSYSRADIIFKNVLSTEVRIDSGIGFLAIQLPKWKLSPKWVVINSDDFHRSSAHTYANGFPSPWGEASSRIWGRFEYSKYNYGLCVPYWILVFAFTTFAAAPWIRWRFSLRTLLIATARLALVLGLIMYVAGK
jgi:hypothetical protein